MPLVVDSKFEHEAFVNHTKLTPDKLRASPLRVQLLADQRVRYLAENPAFSGNRSSATEIQRTSLSGVEQFAKRAVDILGASLALVLQSRVMLLTALAIKLESPAPVLFRQSRSGFNAKRCLIFKSQLFNVLRGDMSPVGPRPHSVAHNSSYGKLLSDYAFGHHVKPGITGWLNCAAAVPKPRR
jgi:lipopolysaccharide/colanic/teichoic acid biosynthesis glycosyltransferase